MKKENFHFPDKIIDELASKCKGIIDENSFNKIINTLENESSKYYFDSLAQGNFYRVINSFFDISTFLKELINFPHHAEILIAIVSSSNYLTDIVVQNPEFLYQVFDGDYLKKVLSKKELEIELTNSVSKFKNFETKVKLIRQFKKRYILKIGLQDILHLHDLNTITFQLSILAKVILSFLFDLCNNEILNKYNLKNVNNKFCICALGKLGGDELNYSSDVDLIIFYDKNSTFKNCNKDYHEILSESIQLFTKVATQITSSGFIYRIDFRLRPDGKYSPLCKEMTDYIKYYETRGEDWEKQMLIKLSFVSGDTNLYNQFNSFVNSYVYHSVIRDSIKEKIKQMKKNIEKNNLEDDVKTFEGGIRDVEFSVQALQLLNGNKFSELKNGNTLQTLQILFQKNLLKQKEFHEFTDAYIFYRRIEHFLQLMNDTQTHRLPEDYETQVRLSKYLMLKSIDDFKKKVNHKKNIVRKIYNSILAVESKDESLFSNIKFENSKQAEINLTFLKTGTGIIGRKEFDTNTIKSFEKIENQLYRYLQNCDYPDTVLENFTKVIRFSNYPSIWFSELRNEKFFDQLLNVCQYSKKAINILINSKSCGEIFLSRKVYLKNYSDEFENFNVQELTFVLSVQLSLGLISGKKFSEVFSEYLDYHISKEFNLIFNNKNIFIGALGSFGAKTISFYSDIDLIVVVYKIDDEFKTESEFQIFLQKLKDKLHPLEIDFRLRPEGKKAQLVWDLENYKSYLNNRAKIWEFQSLCKLRFISGDKNVFKEFLIVIESSLNNYSEEFIKNEIKFMHSNITKKINSKSIKNVIGGLNTIDFVFQFLILKEKNRKHFDGKYFTTIKKIASKNNDIKILLNDFKSLKEIEIVYQNVYDNNNYFIDLDNRILKILLKYFQFENEIIFRKKIQQVFNQNFEIFKKIIDKNEID